MNLLESESPWIPVQTQGTFQHITLETLLCSEGDYQLALARDDMEAAALQLLVALTQTLFMPADRQALRTHADQPLTTEAYRAATEQKCDWFQLDHPKTPFMQSRGVKAKKPTPIQKLFIGLPEGNNHAFFNRPGEIHQTCPSCTVIALFNQASNCPSFGGGFKANLRGSAPVTTFAAGSSLRETVWLNVLTKESVDALLPDSNNDLPNWVDPIQAKQKIPAHSIGLVRGLFWQPARVELLSSEHTGDRCDACHNMSEQLYTSFNKEKFVYDIVGLWPHPHSPRVWDLKRDVRDRERFVSYTTNAPAWTQLNHYLMVQQTSIPAPVISQFQDIFQGNRKLNLLTSGYRNKQASILLRRHELFSIKQDWANISSGLENAIHMALEIRRLLRSKLYGFAKTVGAQVYDGAEQRFDKQSEAMIHGLLRDMTHKERREILNDFRQKILSLARNLFDQATQPYRHTPAGLRQYTKSKNSFEAEIAKLN